MEYKSDGDTYCDWHAWFSHRRIDKRTGGFGNKRMSGDHSNYSIVEIGQDTKKSLGCLRRLAVTQTPGKNHPLTLMLKTLRWVKKKNNDNQQNSECRLCDDRDKTINHTTSKCSKLMQKKYKKRHNWVGKGIHWELCKKLKFNHTTKWYIHKPESLLKNETHKILKGFEI